MAQVIQTLDLRWEIDSVEGTTDKIQGNPYKYMETLEGEWLGLCQTAHLSLVELGIDVGSCDFQARICLSHCTLLTFVGYSKSKRLK